MKAVYIEAHGGLEVLSYGERPDPVIEPHEVKLRVRASALNRLDLYTPFGSPRNEEGVSSALDSRGRSGWRRC